MLGKLTVKSKFVPVITQNWQVRRLWDSIFKHLKPPVSDSPIHMKALSKSDDSSENMSSKT